MTSQLSHYEGLPWARAMRDARHIMGRVRTRSGPRHNRTAWAADEDPLAWWNLVELLVSYHERALFGAPAAPQSAAGESEAPRG